MKQILRMTMAAMLAMMLAQIAYAQTFTCDIAVDF